MLFSVLFCEAAVAIFGLEIEPWRFAKQVRRNQLRRDTRITPSALSETVTDSNTRNIRIMFGNDFIDLQLMLPNRNAELSHRQRFPIHTLRVPPSPNRTITLSRPFFLNVRD